MRPSAVRRAVRTGARAATVGLVLGLVLQAPVAAQGLDRDEAVDAIVGSEVKTEQVDAAAAARRVLAAIGNAGEAAAKVRRTFALEALEIAFVPDIEQASDRVAAALSEHERQIEALREAIEGSALFFHAVDSRSVMVRDIIGLDFPEDGAARIFVKEAREGR